MGKIKNKRVIQKKCDLVAGIIENRISDKEYPPGFKLPPIRQLSRDFGVSLLTVQNAIKILAGKDIVKAVGGCGVFVKGTNSTKEKDATFANDIDSWLGCGMMRKELSYDVFSMKEKTTELFKKLVNLFEIDNPDVKINLKPRKSDKDFEDTLKKAETLADITNVMIAPNHPFGSLVEEGFFAPINEFIENDKVLQKEIVPKFLKNLIFGNKIMALPMISSANVLVYNKRIFKDAGISGFNADAEISDIISAAQKIKKQTNKYGIAFSNIYSLFCWLGADIYDPRKKEFTFDKPKTRKCLKIFKEINKVKDTTAPGFAHEEVMTKDFLDGKIGIISTFTYLLPALKEAANFDYGTILPRLDKGGFSFCGSTVNCISAKTKYPEACWRWVKFLASEKAQKMLSQIHMPVTLKALHEFEKFIKPEELSLSYLIEKSEFIYPNLKGFGEFIGTILNYEASKLIKGIQGIDETINSIQKQANAYFKSEVD